MNKEQQNVIKNILNDKLRQAKKDYNYSSNNPELQKERETILSQANKDIKLKTMLHRKNKLLKEIEQYSNKKYEVTLCTDDQENITFQDYKLTPLKIKIKKQNDKLDNLQNVLLFELAGGVGNIDTIIAKIDKRIAEAIASVK